jgi:hypothetical protein
MGWVRYVAGMRSIRNAYIIYITQHNILVGKATGNYFLEEKDVNERTVVLYALMK